MDSYKWVRSPLILLMDEILHRFSYVSHPFQTLNLKIGLLATLRKGMLVNDRNPASPPIQATLRGAGSSTADNDMLVVLGVMQDFVHPPYGAPYSLRYIP